MDMNNMLSKLCDEKIADFTSQIIAKTAASTENPADPSYISKNTKQNMLYHLKRDRATMRLIKHLIEANPGVVLSSDDKDQLIRLTILSTERGVGKYVFKEGDSIFDIMTKHEKLSRRALEEKLAKQGLRADFETGKIVKQIVKQDLRADFVTGERL